MEGVVGAEPGRAVANVVANVVDGVAGEVEVMVEAGIVVDGGEGVEEVTGRTVGEESVRRAYQVIAVPGGGE